MAECDEQMPRSFFSALIPDTRRGLARNVWIGIILLSPAAMALGLWLLIRTEPRPPIHVTLTRESAVRIARVFAARRGVDAPQWMPAVITINEQNALNFLNKKSDRAGAWRFAPPLHGRVTLTPDRAKGARVGVDVNTGSGAAVQIEPLPDGFARVDISLDERVVGYEFKGLQSPSKSVSDDESLRIAKAELPAGLSFGDPAITPTATGREYSFHAPYRDVEITAAVRVENGRATKLAVSAGAPGGQIPPDSDMQGKLMLVGIILASSMAGFSIYRYAVRSMQGEVSYARSALAPGLCAVFFLVIQSDIVRGAEGTPLLIIWLALLLFALLAGALLAVAYGSGEGDIRERWPARLTSLDAVFTGRLWSRNVGASILVGFAFAGWCLCALGILSQPFRDPHAIRGSPTMLAALFRFPYLLALTTGLVALAYCAAGLMQPLAVLIQYGSRVRRWWIPITAVCAFLISGLRSTEVGFAEYLIGSAVLAAALLIPFFRLDLLASLFCVAVTVAAMGAPAVIVSLPQERSTLLHIPTAITLVVFAILAIRYARPVTEEQVRPVYARHIAERTRLEAEVSAAREAQLRLLPAGAPSWNGLRISAACVPAEIVGGDFYDFFSLSESRLGVFVAEGNNRGLAAALNIALAKGYLMQVVERSGDPVEILARLESALVSMLGASANPQTAFAFAVIDTNSGMLRFARTGDYPRVIVSSAITVVTERIAAVKGRAVPLMEGSARLAAGDQILLFTDGIGRKLSANGREDCDRALLKLAAENDEAEELSRRVLAASRYEDTPDDLTLVVIRIENVGESALEVVA